MISSRVGVPQAVPDHWTATRIAESSAARLDALDGLRGLAAFVVIIWHFFLAFIPLRVGSFPGFDPAQGLIGTPIFGLINGEAAVTFFFVLSGFVLPVKFLRDGDNAILLRAAAKRWFRLAGLVMIAVLVSYALVHLGLYFHHQAAAISDSSWLDHFAEGKVESQNVGFIPALMQGTVWTFLRGDSYFDPSLWTMHLEFIGSLLTFGLAALLLRAGWKSTLWITIIGLAIVQVGNSYLTAFVVGTSMSALMARRMPQISMPLACALILSAMLLFAFKEPRGIFAFVADLGIPTERAQIVFHTLASAMAICAGLGNPSVRQFLSSAPLRFLGTISFAMYLIHLPVYFSFTSRLFVALNGVMPRAATDVLSFTASAALILPLSYALARLDGLWLGFVDRRVMTLIF